MWCLILVNSKNPKNKILFKSKYNRQLHEKNDAIKLYHFSFTLANR